MENKRVFRFSIAFKPQWILGKRGDTLLPADRVSEELGKVFELESISKGTTGCNGSMIVSEDTERSAVADRMKELIRGLYEDVGDAFVVQVEEAPVQEVSEEPVPEKPEEVPEDIQEETRPQQETPASRLSSILKGTAAPAAAAPAPKKDVRPAMERIEELVGAEEFKALAREVNSVAQSLKEFDLIDAFIRRSYLISVNDGYGLSTYLELFADLVEELGLMSLPEQKRIVEVRVPMDGSIKEPFSQAVNSLGGFGGGKIVCIDISEWMSKTVDKEFRRFLKDVNDRSGSNIVFFRVPFIETTVLADIHNNINDQLFITDVSVVPFDLRELDLVAEKILGVKKFTMDEGAKELFHARIAEEKSDGRFYGVNTVKKVADEMLYTKQLSCIKKGQFDMVITADDIAGLVKTREDIGKSGMEMLDELVGVDKIRERVMEIISQIEVSLRNAKLETPCIHMRFVGNPGTGKTTVARIIGKILAERGILRVGSFFEYGGRDFCAPYVGQTAPKTSAMCRDAYGSVLFIDEAYTLYQSDRDDNDFGKEAIATLIAEMENHRTDLMVIMAGYPDDMEMLMNGNAGLRERMPYTLEFPNYTKEQLAEIYLGMCRKNFALGEGFEEAARDYFLKLTDEFIGNKQFSNGRYCRNLYERTWGKAVLRCQLASIPCEVLLVDDLALAAEDSEFSNIIEKKTKHIGFN